MIIIQSDPCPEGRIHQLISKIWNNSVPFSFSKTVLNASSIMSTKPCVIKGANKFVTVTQSPVLLFVSLFICCVFFFVCVCKCFWCLCVNEQHLQEGRKAQQYLDQCWKQMENVSAEGGREGGRKRNVVYGKYSLLGTASCVHLAQRMNEMLTEVTKRQIASAFF